MEKIFKIISNGKECSNDVGLVLPDEEVEIAGRDDFTGAVLDVSVALVEVRTDVSEAFNQVTVTGQDQRRNKAVARVHQLEHRPEIQLKLV